MTVSETIEEILAGIDESQYGRDMRDYIHKGIQKCYEEGSAGETDLVAREAIADLQDDMEAAVPLWVNCGTISSLPTTLSNAYITADMMCTAYVIGTPSAQRSDWTITTAAGAVTISGSISGSTTLDIKLENVNTETAS